MARKQLLADRTLELSSTNLGGFLTFQRRRHRPASILSKRRSLAVAGRHHQGRIIRLLRSCQDLFGFLTPSGDPWAFGLNRVGSTLNASISDNFFFLFLFFFFFFSRLSLPSWESPLPLVHLIAQFNSFIGLFVPVSNTLSCSSDQLASFKLPLR